MSTVSGETSNREMDKDSEIALNGFRLGGLQSCFKIVGCAGVVYGRAKLFVMISLKVVQAQLGRPLRLLFLGAHSDDIEIGCGAMVLDSLHQFPCEVMWSVFSGSRNRAKEAGASALEFLQNVSKPRIQLLSFRESFFPDQWSEIKMSFEALRKKLEPDIIFTHYRHDRHQDHRVLSDLTWNTFRNHLIFEYEIPKYDGDMAQPACFYPVSSTVAQKKADLLQKHFNSQGSKHWFDQALFAGLMRLRGMECAAESGFAEAFYIRKLVFGFLPGHSGPHSHLLK